MTKIDEIQNKIADLNLDGWLLFDFRHSNPLSLEWLGIGPDAHLSRRLFYWIPKKGEPVALVHGIEKDVVKALTGKKECYQTYDELGLKLQTLLKGSKKVAMEYSPKGAIPYLSKIDGGTLEWIRGFGVEVVSSWQLLEKPLTSSQIQSHLQAANVLEGIVDNCWDVISKNLGKITEWDVQQLILQGFKENECITSDAPNCSVNAHSANPHYCPSKGASSVIQENDFILIDLWCKKRGADSIYADITRVGVAAKEPTKKQQEIFSIVKEAADASFSLVQDRFNRGEKLAGWEVDQCARDVIRRYGFGEYFIHRLGHNIGKNCHGNGTHLDNFETHDDRILTPGTCFSIEPGIYLPDNFGVRLEFDVLITLDGKVQATGGVQDKITCLLS